MSGRHKRLSLSTPRASRPLIDRRKTRLLAVTGALTATTAIASACTVSEGAPVAADRPADPGTPAASAPTTDSLQAARQAQRADRGLGRQPLTAPAPAAKAKAPAAKPKAKAPRPEAVAQPRKQAVKKRPAARSTRAAVVGGKSCKASFYHEGQMTASGERFNPNALTAAHKTLPLDSRVRVTNPRNGASVVVRINDRGPYAGNRCLDLSRAAFDRIGSLDSGVMQVRYQVL